MINENRRSVIKYFLLLSSSTVMGVANSIKLQTLENNEKEYLIRVEDDGNMVTISLDSKELIKIVEKDIL